MKASRTTHAGGSRMRIPRSRGTVGGLLLVPLGLWGAVIPFVGPYIDFAFGADRPWEWSTARGWLEVLPGIATVVGGVLLVESKNRATALFGSWMAVLGGFWFVVGRAVSASLGLADMGVPVAAYDTKWVWLELTYFTGLGALIVFIAAASMGRLSVRSLRDIRYADATEIFPAQDASPMITATHGGAEDSRLRSLSNFFRSRRPSAH